MDFSEIFSISSCCDNLKMIKFWTQNSLGNEPHRANTSIDSTTWSDIAAEDRFAGVKLHPAIY